MVVSTQAHYPKVSTMVLTIAMMTLMQFVVVSAQQTEEATVVLPGDPLLLGSYGDGDGTPPSEDFFPIMYTVFGDKAVAINRMIIPMNEACPSLVVASDSSTIDAASLPPVTTRGVGENVLPRAFPIKVCQVVLDTDELKQAWTNNEIYYDNLEPSSVSNVPIPADPKRFGLMGDTGLRVKAKSLGITNCTSSSSDADVLWQIPYCPLNVTEEDMTAFPATGDFQSLDDWPLKSLMDLLAEKQPEVTVYVGDYLYRQGPCPENNTDGGDCVGINGPSQYFTEDTSPEEIQRQLNGTVMNFVPGNWGDTWYGWWADFFYPALELMKVSPLIGIRGNHEICSRAGGGYMLFMSPMDYPTDTVGGTWCIDYQNPWTVPFANEQFLLLDDSSISPYLGGIDDFTSTPDSCPGPPAEGEPPLVAVPQDRYKDPSQTKLEVSNQITYYTQALGILQNEAQNYDTNFYAAHRPVFGVACNDTWMVTLDWTIQQSLAKNTFDRVSACLAGHMHWLEALTFVNDTLPKQIVVGHGGTELLENYVQQDALPGLELKVGVNGMYQGVVDRGITDMTRFGFGIMERNDAGDYDVQFHSLDQTNDELVLVDFPMTIPKGPRVGGGSESSACGPLSYTMLAAALSFVSILLCFVH